MDHSTVLSLHPYGPLAASLATSADRQGFGDWASDQLFRAGATLRDPDLVSRVLDSLDPAKAESIERAAYTLKLAREGDSLILVRLMAVAGDPTDTERVRALGAELASQGRTAQAGAIYDAVSAACPEDVYSAWNGATLLMIGGQAQAALSAWERARAGLSEAGRFAAVAPLFDAAEGRSSGLSVKSLDAMSEALEAQPAWIRRRINDLAGAITARPAGEGLNPDALSALNTHLESLGLPAFSRGISSAQTSDDPLVLARLTAGSGNTDATIEALNRAVAGRTLSPEDRLDVAEIYAGIGRYDDALKAMPQALDAAMVERLLASCSAAANDVRKFDFLAALGEKSPGHSALTQARADTAFAAGLQDEALAAYRELTAPGERERFRMAVCQLMLGQDEEAAAVFQQLVDTPRLGAESRRYLALIAFTARRFPEAVEHMQLALSFHQEKAGWQIELAAFARSMRDHALAARAAQAGMKASSPSEPDHARAEAMFLCESALSGDAELIERARAYARKTGLDGGLQIDRRLMMAVFLFNTGAREPAREVVGALAEIVPSDARIAAWQDWLQYDGPPGDWKLPGGQGPQPVSGGNGAIPSELVALGVPAYNEARYLADALNSIWLQSLPHWRAFIVDDRSSDETPDIAADYARLDPRFELISHSENSGLPASRNSALERAKGPLVTFLDGDDVLTFHANWDRVDVLAKAGTDASVIGAYGAIQPLDELVFGEVPVSARTVPGRSVSFLTAGYQAPFNAHAPMLRRTALAEAGGFDASLRNGAEDWDCWLRLLRRGYRFEPTGRVCGLYRQKRASMVRSMAALHVETSQGLLTRLLNEEAGDGVVFGSGLAAAQAGAALTKRALNFAAMAELAGDRAGADAILAAIPLSIDEIDAGGIDVAGAVMQGVHRVFAGAFSEEAGTSRMPYIRRKADRLAEQFRLRLAGGSRKRLKATASLDGTAIAAGEPHPSDSPAELPRAAYLRLEEPAADRATPDRIAALRNRFAGQRCFIIGNGPSLNETDLSRIGNAPAIGVNGLFYKCEEIGWWPRFYCVEDSSVMRENLDAIRAFPAEQKFFPSLYRDLHPASEGVNFFVMNRGFYEPKSPNYGIPRFSTDFARQAYCGQTVTYINLQLAYFLGFKEVVLVGMDFSYVIPGEFEKRGDIIVSTGDDPNHFHPEYFGKGKSWKDPKLDLVLLNYRMAKLVYEAAGRRIVNATVGGRLELFDRVPFDTLFD